MNKTKEHKPYTEAFAFYDFVRKSLDLKSIDAKDRQLYSKFDFFWKFPFLTNYPLKVNSNFDSAYVEIKYTNNIEHILSYVSMVESKEIPLIIISLISDENLEKVKSILGENSSVEVVGASFVYFLAKNNKVHWWNFIASCADCPEVEMNEDGTGVRIKWIPLAAIEVGLYPEIKLDKIFELSKINEVDFIDRFNDRKFLTSIIIGNGVSIPFGSDPWNQLSNYLFDFLKPKYVDNVDAVASAIGNSTFALTAMSKSVIQKNKYNDALYSCIYRKYEDTMHVPNTLLRAITQSKANHSKLNLITYNYDMFLEMDYKKITGSTMHSVCSSTGDKRYGEPKIKHVHGLVPYKRKSHLSGVVLTQDDYYKTYKGDTWTVRTQKEALDGNCLYVGSSMSDLFQMSLISNVRDQKIRKGIKNWKCFALLCFAGLSKKDIATVYNFYLKKGVYVIFTKTFEELASTYLNLVK